MVLKRDLKVAGYDSEEMYFHHLNVESLDKFRERVKREKAEAALKAAQEASVEMTEDGEELKKAA